MIAALRLFCIEARRSPAVWFVPVVVAITWYYGQRSHAAEVTLWSKASAQLGESLVVLGPLVGGLAAWIAGRDRRRGTEDLLATAPRSQVTRDLLGYASSVGWGLLAYLAAVSAVFIMTYRAATWGSPDLLPVLTAAATIILAGAIGYTAGLYFPSRFTPPLVAIALVLALIVPTSGAARVVEEGDRQYVTYESPVRNFTPFTYVNPGDYDPTFESWPDVGLPLIVWLLAITGLAVAAIAIRRNVSHRAGAVLLISLMCASIAGAALYGTNERRDRASEPEPVCRDGRVTVCMHPAYEAVLDDVAVLVETLAEPFAGLPGSPTRVEQSLSNENGEAVPDGVLRRHFYNLILNGDYGRALDAGSVVCALICEGECQFSVSMACEFSGEMRNCGLSAFYSNPAQAAIGTWALRQADIEVEMLETGSFHEADNPESHPVLEASERFGVLDEDVRRAWLREHIIELRAGELTLADLP